MKRNILVVVVLFMITLTAKTQNVIVSPQWVNDKMCVGVEKERLMVRLDPAKYEEVMEKDECKPMDFTGRVMKGFVFVDADVLTTKKKLEYWIKLALEYNKIAKASKKSARRTGGKTVKKKK